MSKSLKNFITIEVRSFDTHKCLMEAYHAPSEYSGKVYTASTSPCLPHALVGIPVAFLGSDHDPGGRPAGGLFQCRCASKQSHVPFSNTIRTRTSLLMWPHCPAMHPPSRLGIRLVLRSEI